jgi:hypothetical protein
MRTLDDIIKLFQEVEAGVEGQLIGYHLHHCIKQANDQVWETNPSYPPTFSGFLTALKNQDE